MGKYEVIVTSSARKDIIDLPADVASRVYAKLKQLELNPRSHGAVKLTSGGGL